MMGKTSTRGAGRPTKYRTRGGVYKTVNGTYLAQKMISGVRYNACFKLKREARQYVEDLTNRSKITG
jgi:hypothetical protein